MSKVTFFIDGFNVYHALIGLKGFSKYKWLNYRKLCQNFLKKSEKILNIYYFTALADWDLEKRQKHQILIKALESVDIKIIYGEFKRKEKFCNLCKRKYVSREEKQTDVNIAITLLETAFKNEFDKAIIISADSDLIPAITAVQKNFPNKQIGVILPIGRRSESLKQICDFYMRMKETHLKSSIFPERIKLNNNQIIKCPKSWIKKN